jgi:hypothetical protein
MEKKGVISIAVMISTAVTLMVGVSALTTFSENAKGMETRVDTNITTAVEAGIVTNMSYMDTTDRELIEITTPGPVEDTAEDAPEPEIAEEPSKTEEPESVSTPTEDESLYEALTNGATEDAVIQEESFYSFSGDTDDSRYIIKETGAVLYTDAAKRVWTFDKDHHYWYYQDGDTRYYTDDKNQQFYFDENHRRWLYDEAKHRWYWDDAHYIVDTKWDGSNQGGSGWGTTPIVRDAKKEGKLWDSVSKFWKDNHPDLNNGWGNND